MVATLRNQKGYHLRLHAPGVTVVYSARPEPELVSHWGQCDGKVAKPV